MRFYKRDGMRLLRVWNWV